MSKNYNDPLLKDKPEGSEEIRDLWYFSDLASSIRRQKYSFQEGKALKTALELGEWEEGGTSLKAWRALWVSDSVDLKLKAIKEELHPPLDSNLDWFSSDYFRRKSLKDIFLPKYVKNNMGYGENVFLPEREELAEALHQKFPGLLALYLESELKQLREKKFEYFFSSPWAITAKFENHSDFKRIYESDGFELIIRNNEEFTASDLLNLGLAHKNKALVKMALKNGASPNDYVEDKRGEIQTIFQTLIARSDVESIQEILSDPSIEVDLEKVDQRGRTPFLRAAMAGNVPLMELLKESGANIKATDRYGQNALMVALERLSLGQRMPGSKYSPAWVLVPHSEDTIVKNVMRLQKIFNVLTDMGVDKEHVANPYKKSKKNPIDPFEALPSARRKTSAAKAGENWEAQFERIKDEFKAVAPTSSSHLLESWKEEVRLNWTLIKLVDLKPEVDSEYAEIKPVKSIKIARF